MKKIILMMALAATALFTVTACGDDDDDKGGGNNQESTVTLPVPKYKNDAAKFKVPSTEIKFKGENIKVETIELTESGRYLVTYQKSKAASRETRAVPELVYQMGLFTKEGDGKYTLTDFARIIIEKDGNKYMLTLIPAGEDGVEVEVTKLATIAASELTDYICRTWNITNTRIQGNADGVNVAKDFPGSCNMNELVSYARSKGVTIKEDPDPNTVVEGVTFSSSSSYIINYLNGKKDVGTWRWTKQSTGTGEIAYDWDGNHMGFEAIKHTGVVTFDGSRCKLALPVSDGSATLEVVYTLIPAN